MKLSTTVPGLVLIALCGLLMGCFGGRNPDAKCDEPAEYQSSVSVPSVTVPEGLTGPKQPSGYSMPPSAADVKVVKAGCLARPPDYFRKTPAVPPAE